MRKRKEKKGKEEEEEEEEGLEKGRETEETKKITAELIKKKRNRQTSK